MSETTKTPPGTSAHSTRVVAHLVLLAMLVLGSFAGAKASWWIGLNYGQVLLGAIIGGTLLLMTSWALLMLVCSLRRQAA